ncbi:MAG: N-acetyl-gamma-glutamyl-phosphate reductase [Desulfobacterales bacterium]|nr:N-acetyl-gamma-glutamyl-phosphate reductase [Desulfobacterales bacterium]
MIKAAVVGATGYAGAELVRILAGHPDIDLAMITSRQYAGERLDAVYPALAGQVDLYCEAYDAQKVCAASDVVFLALPHKLPMAFVPELIAQGKKVVDLSADFRFQDAAVYEAAYQPHSARELLKKSVYGLCEVYADRIKAADLIGNPGCYPTSVLLPLIPLLKAGWLNPGSLIADSKSGVSGAGRSLSLAAHFCEVHESFKAYKVAEHRHAPEMNAVLSATVGAPVHITFVPHLVPMSRGMQTTVYADLKEKVTADDILNCLATFYRDRPFMRICPTDRTPDSAHVRGTNFCDLGFKLDTAANRLILLSAIDNLVKGAAGQAVQNMNLMFGLDETAGLMQVPYPL